MSDLIKKITLIGSGKVASQLGFAFHQSGVEIVQVWSRNLAHANNLAEKLDCRGINKMSQLKATDLFVIAISDDGIKKTLKDLPLNTPAVHTSGNTPLLERDKTAISGVLYPLQTFGSQKPDWKNIPICIEASNEEFLKPLFSLAETLSKKVKIISSAERSILHTAAVLTCNFTNHMAAVAEGFLADHNLKIDLLQPLIAQTFENISEGNIKSKQTGPAVREDYGTLDDHIENLKEYPDIKSLYLALSKHIIQFHHG